MADACWHLLQRLLLWLLSGAGARLAALARSPGLWPKGELSSLLPVVFAAPSMLLAATRLVGFHSVVHFLHLLPLPVNAGSPSSVAAVAEQPSGPGAWVAFPVPTSGFVPNGVLAGWPCAQDAYCGCTFASIQKNTGRNMTCHPPEYAVLCMHRCAAVSSAQTAALARPQARAPVSARSACPPGAGDAQPRPPDKATAGAEIA